MRSFSELQGILEQAGTKNDPSVKKRMDALRAKEQEDRDGKKARAAQRKKYWDDAQQHRRQNAPWYHVKKYIPNYPLHEGEE